MAHLPQLVRLLCDLRLAVLALAIVVEAVTRSSAVVLLVLLVAVAFSYLPVRRWERMAEILARHPALQVLDVALATCLMLLASATNLMLIYALVTTVLGGLVFGRLGAVLAGGLLAANLLAAAAVSEVSGTASIATTLTLVVYAMLYAVAGIGSVRLRQLLADIDETRTRAQLESGRAAHAEERARLSREMHDGVSKTLHGVNLLATGLRRHLDAGHVEQSAELASQLGEAARSAANDSRRLLADLRADRPSESFEDALGRVVRDWGEVSGVQVDLDVDRGTGPAVELGVGTRYEVLCIVGEALENVSRHAAATRVAVGVEQGAGWVTLRIADDGRGFDVPPDLRALGRAGHYGVVGMHERASRVGGRVEIGPREPRGAEVELRVPVALGDDDLTGGSLVGPLADDGGER